MGIKRVNNLVRNDILDENDNKIGEAIFDPTDIFTYNKFFNLVDSLCDIEKLKKRSSKIKNIPSNELKSFEDFEKVKDIFNDLRNVTEEYIVRVDKLSEDINSIFGDGVSELLLNGGKNIENLIPLIDWATPYFKKVKSQKQSKYLEDIEILNIDE